MKKLFFFPLMITFGIMVSCSSGTDGLEPENTTLTRVIDNQGFGTYDNPVQAGSFSGEFYYTTIIDTKEDPFYPTTSGGNTYYIKIFLEHQMNIVIHNYGYYWPQGTSLRISSSDYSQEWFYGQGSQPDNMVILDISSTFNYPWDWKCSANLDLTAGEYIVEVTGYKVTNAGQHNGPISTTIIGRSSKFNHYEPITYQGVDANFPLPLGRLDYTNPIIVKAKTSDYWNTYGREGKDVNYILDAGGDVYLRMSSPEPTMKGLYIFKTSPDPDYGRDIFFSYDNAALVAYTQNASPANVLSMSVTLENGKYLLVAEDDLQEGEFSLTILQD